MLVKVSELKGRALNYAVAVCERGQPTHINDSAFVWETGIAGGAIIVQKSKHFVHDGFNPQGNWAHGGPLIDKYAIELMFLNCPKTAVGRHRVLTDNGILICAEKQKFTASADISILIPVCRAVVYSKHSYEIEIPDELVEA
ncbi:phage protein NinX family protein [Thalassospira xiamenensis]|uniref:phage protein NinX family protein n=1 Tax=Thalassospira xiamenensis TaxID=220697 RepID=UPI003AA9A686